jgi:aspartate 1-decarboxylase
MQIQVLKSKIHREFTGADLNYIGSITTIDEIEASNIIEGKSFHVNINNGERFETYAIKGDENSGEITLNGPAASTKDDIIIIISYAFRI